MKLKEFDYTLPEGLIADQPLRQRDQARLMVIERKTGKISYDIFRNLGDYLPEKSLLVFNNSKVIPARLLGTKERSGGRVEVFLLRRLKDGRSFETLMRPLRRIRKDDRIVFDADGFSAQVVDPDRRIVRFDSHDVFGRLEKIGHMPLPPYIKRRDTELDKTYYQTVYARYPGSVAAPTAGLHFSNELLLELKKNAHEVRHVLLHVNYGTFKPVEKENIEDHCMHEEFYSMPLATLEAVKKAKAAGRKIVAVGTTSTRVIESVFQTGRKRGSTRLFIYPGYKFRAVDALITNFHLPFSSLLMLVYAFGSVKLMRRAYHQAIREKYRFYSYGDGMIII